MKRSLLWALIFSLFTFSCRYQDDSRPSIVTAEAVKESLDDQKELTPALNKKAATNEKQVLETQEQSEVEDFDLLDGFYLRYIKEAQGRFDREKSLKAILREGKEQREELEVIFAAETLVNTDEGEQLAFLLNAYQFLSLSESSRLYEENPKFTEEDLLERIVEVSYEKISLRDLRDRITNLSKEVNYLDALSCFSTSECPYFLTESFRVSILENQVHYIKERVLEFNSGDNG